MSTEPRNQNNFNHSFNIKIAMAHGVENAIMLDNIAFWTRLNSANRTHYHDGRYWTYNSVRGFTELFPYWSTRQLRTILDNLISLGLILKGNYNKLKMDRTSWFALTDLGLEILEIYPLKPDEGEIFTICQKRQTGLSEVTNSVVKIDKAIPDTIPDTITDNTTTASAFKLVADVSSSISCNGISKNKDEAVDFNGLRKLGFCNADITELSNLYCNDLPKLQLSIDYLVFDAEVNNRADKIDVSLENWFMKIMRRKSGFNAPPGYKKRATPSEQPKTETNLNKKVYIDHFHNELANWFYKLTKQEKQELGFGTSFLYDKNLEDYYGMNVWPAISQALLTKIQA